MGIFDFFKTKESASEIKKIKFTEINIILAEEKQKIIKDEKTAISLVKEAIADLSLELKTEILALNQIDLSKRKVEERLKIIVLENAKVFTGYLEKLKEKMENLQSSKLVELIKEIDINLKEYKKKSFMSKEKTSIYIGKELAAVEETMNSFCRNMDKILEDNKKLIEMTNMMEKSELLHDEIKQQKNIEEKIQLDIEEISKNITELKKQKVAHEKERMKIKESREYMQKVKRQQEFQTQKNEIKEEFISLRSLIDIKELARIHHSIPKNMKIIKEYSDNIQDAFEKEKGKDILEISVKNKEKISEKINRILEKEKKIREFIPERDDLEENQKEIDIIDCRIKELEEEKTAFENKISDSQNKIKDLKSQLAQEIKKIGFKLE